MDISSNSSTIDGICMIHQNAIVTEGRSTKESVLFN
jgi:hypothetical protein